MKAFINGIQVEGTPQEIAEYVRIVNESLRSKPYIPYVPDTIGIPDWTWCPDITCYNDSSNGPNPEVSLGPLTGVWNWLDTERR